MHSPFRMVFWGSFQLSWLGRVHEGPLFNLHPGWGNGTNQRALGTGSCWVNFGSEVIRRGGSWRKKSDEKGKKGNFSRADSFIGSGERTKERREELMKFDRF